MIEDNPSFLTSKEINKLNDENQFIWDEFKRTFNFNNTYLAKIEYSNSKDKLDSNLEIYHSKYRRIAFIQWKSWKQSLMLLKKNPYLAEHHTLRRKK